MSNKSRIFIVIGVVFLLLFIVAGNDHAARFKQGVVDGTLQVTGAKQDMREIAAEAAKAAVAEAFAARDAAIATEKAKVRETELLTENGKLKQTIAALRKQRLSQVKRVCDVPARRAQTAIPYSGKSGESAPAGNTVVRRSWTYSIEQTDAVPPSSAVTPQAPSCPAPATPSAEASE